MQDGNVMLAAKVIAVVVLYLFVPVTALTYYVFRRHRRIAEIGRIFTILSIEPGQRRAYDDEKSGYYFLCAVAYASLVSGLGLCLLFLGSEIGLETFPPVTMGNVQFPHAGSRFIFAMAFLGAYLWGLQYVFRRYALNDLVPSVYYSFSMRLILAAFIAMVIYNVYEAFASGDNTAKGITVNLWPALAFLIGMFPQRGLRWLMERIPLLASEPAPSVRLAPLDMIEGIEIHDVLRLEELGIDTCYDLAHVDFVPLILKTPYSARQLVDWILQAKLCLYFGDAVKDLRLHGIRTVIDLDFLTPDDVEQLASGTTATRSALQHAREAVKHDPEIHRLRQAAQLLGRYWEKADELTPPS